MKPCPVFLGFSDTPDMAPIFDAAERAIGERPVEIFRVSDLIRPIDRPDYGARMADGRLLRLYVNSGVVGAAVNQTPPTIDITIESDPESRD